ncbi:MAG TPA: hypothetical protein VJP80_01925 [Candidatus Saccharimonadales bacterium]|nr:hypothetical protein [Candidatus Saccharimonadales bacterium]
MALAKFPYGVENKVLSKAQLDRYFDVTSLEALIFDLRQYGRRGYFGYEITLSPEYLDWERARHDVVLNLDALKPPRLFGVSQQTHIRLVCQSPRSEAKRHY